MPKLKKPPRDRLARPSTSDPELDLLLQMLQTQNTYNLFRWLSEAVIEPTARPGSTQDAAARIPGEDAGTQIPVEVAARVDLVANLSATVFSEVLHSLDPLLISKKLDELRDIVVSPEMATLTPLGSSVTMFGTRMLYSCLSEMLWTVFLRRSEARDEHRRLLPKDYIILMRAAGAASDIGMAKRYWAEIDISGQAQWRNSEMYAEFMRSRFLTSSLSLQHDVSRLRVQPLNLHYTKIKYQPSRLYTLDSIRRNGELALTHRFGHDINKIDFVAHLSRMMRCKWPPRHVYQKGLEKGRADELAAKASYLIALGRTGSMHELTSRLYSIWGVRVMYQKKIQFERVLGATPMQRRALLYPTAELLDAVVHAFCSNCEVSLALKTVTHIAQSFGIHVPDKVWFDLLKWAAALSSPKMDREWTIAGFPTRKVAPNTVDAIWTVMTSDPYNVRPGFDQYDILIRSMLRRLDVNNPDSLLPALELMRQMKPMYQAKLREHEEAIKALAEVRALGQADEGPAIMRLRRANTEKWHMWFCFHRWCDQIMNSAYSAKADSKLLTRWIPMIVDEFRPFLLRDTWYPMPTGIVRLREPREHGKVQQDWTIEDLPRVRPSMWYRYRSHRVIQDDLAEPEGAPFGKSVIPQKQPLPFKAEVLEEELMVDGMEGVEADTEGMQNEGDQYGQRNLEYSDADRNHDSDETRYGEYGTESEMEAMDYDVDSYGGKQTGVLGERAGPMTDEELAEKTARYLKKMDDAERADLAEFTKRHREPVEVLVDKAMDEAMERVMQADLDEEMKMAMEGELSYEKYEGLQRKKQLAKMGSGAVLDEHGNILTPAQLRWYERHAERNSRLRRVTVRSRAASMAPLDVLLSNNHPEQHGSLAREFA
ncbi:hypothetical protein SBRCBS47491_003709 [Sporothrix bragantina]|uniref:Uncharacterized protein n=1 Tax=Sporothrix bragantina TaxID=671064 RepID=A0ABP0BHQ0_9PEZI